MSKVLAPGQPKNVVKETTPTVEIISSTSSDYDDFTSNSSILDFLSKEQECCSDVDPESIFQEVSRLAGNSTRSVDELIREAESLLRLNNVGARGGSLKKKKSEKQQPKQTIKQLNSKYTKSIESTRPKQDDNFRHKTNKIGTSTPTLQTPTASPFAAFVDNLPTESVISEESTPKDFQNMTFNSDQNDDATTIEAQLGEDIDTDDGTDTMEEITECMETIELVVDEEQLQKQQPATSPQHKNDESNESEGINRNVANRKTTTTKTTTPAATTMHTTRKQHTNRNMKMSASMTALTTAATASSTLSSNTPKSSTFGRRPSCDTITLQQTFYTSQILPSPSLRNIAPLNFNPTQACSPTTPHNVERRNSIGTRRASMNNTPDSGHYSQATATPRQNSPPLRPMATHKYVSCDKSVNSSPKHFVSTLTSPIQPIAALTREHALKQEMEQLQEKLKDTEERLQSLRIQHDSLSQLHRDLRESNTHLQEESETLKLDVQHLNECATVLRTELQAARNDRKEALELQKTLQMELEETRQEKRRALDLKEADAKTIQDLQRQCKEMERILMRKHPDSVSALILACKSPASREQDQHNSRKLLEQRIAQLESDAKEQDKKAQQILANVQARFNSVQAKYETHIADLETQVLSLQEINTKLNEKIESQVRTLDYFVKKRADNYYNNSTQTDDQPTTSLLAEQNTRSLSPAPCTSTSGTQTIKATRDHSTNTIGGGGGAGTVAGIGGSSSQAHSAASSASSTTNSTPNNSRPNSKQSGIRKPMVMASSMSLSTALASKLPVSHSDTTISLSAQHAAAREDAHLLATIRGMRVDLAVKDKAIQRLTRELDECKKTIRKLQREKDVLKGGSGASTSAFRRPTQDDHHMGSSHTPATTETQALREAHGKIKLLESDYKSLHDKRLQDLKALQTAHERELASCHETVRILQQRLNEREDAANGVQRRRKLPVDYYALKAKVSSLERRHTEREERLHMLVEALSKGRLNGALEDLLRDSNNQ